VSERWFHAVSIPGEGEPVELDPAEGRHATRSRQLENGEEIALSDGAGTAARAILSEGERRRASAVVVERILHPAPPRRLHLASALPKGDRLSTLLSMETQLGMTDFTPLAARRSVVQPSAETPGRWQRIAREACK
jgi:16S rRNA (uracil1498-N3)-methyltransferase